MSATNVPLIPSVTPDNLTQVARAVKSILDVREGLTGDPLDQNVTFRDLVDTGLAKVPSWGSGGVRPVIAPGSSSADGYDPTTDFTPPPKPTNVTATGAISIIMLQWDAIPAGYRNHAYSEVWRASTNVIGNAVMIGTSDTRFYNDAVGADHTYYYWVRHVSQANVKGPYQDTSGVSGQTGKEPAYLLTVLNGALTDTEFDSALKARIDLIDAPTTTAGSVNARLSTLQTDVNNSLAVIQGQVNDLLNIPNWSSTESYTTNDQVVYNGGLYKANQASTNVLPTNTTYWTKIGDYTSLGDAVAAHTTQIANLGTNLGQEVTDRSALATQMRGSYAGSDLSLVSEGLIFQERTARASAVSAVATSVTNLTAVVNTKTRSFYQATAPVGTTENPLVIGDVWVDTGITYAKDYFQTDYTIKSNRMYRWDGSQWVEAMDYGFADTFSAINLEQIARVSADNAMSSQINTLISSVNSNTAAITLESNTRASSDSSLASQITTLGATVSANNTTLTGLIQTEATTRANADTSLATLITNLTTTVTNNNTTVTSAISTEATTRANADTALSTLITNLTTTVTNNNTTLSSAIQTEATTRATAVSAVATDLSTLQTTVTNNNTTLTSAISTEATTRATTDDGLLAQYTVKTDVNGYVSGYGLASTLKDATPSSTFAVRADAFYIANPDGPGVAPAMPFIVRTTATTIGGVAVPVGVYITDAFIQNGTISNAKIANAAIDDAKIASLSANKITTGYLSADRIEAASITADKIGSGTISASQTITVGGEGSTAPLVLSGNGEIISNGPLGDKARFYSGNVEIYKNVPNVGSVLYKALSRVEVGVAENNTLVTVPGYFKTQPKIIVSPRNLTLYKASYSNQDQSIQCEARDIAETFAGSMSWQFKGVATLSLAANTGTAVINQASGVQTGNWTSSEYTTAANTTSITPSVTLASFRGNGVSQYYYRTVRWRTEYWNGSSWIADINWTTSNLAASATDSVTTTATFTFPSSGTWKFRIYAEAYDTNGTVFGSTAYEYATDTVSRTDDVSYTTSTGDSFPASGNYAPAYNVPSGWTVTNVSWSFHYSYELIGSYSSGGFGSYPSSGIAYLNMPGVSLSASYAYQGGFGAGYYGEYKSATNVAGSASTSSYAFNVTCSTSGTGASASATMLDLSGTVTRRRPVANSTTASNTFQLNSYAFSLSSSQVLATGSLNWIAMGD